MTACTPCWSRVAPSGHGQRKGQTMQHLLKSTALAGLTAAALCFGAAGVANAEDIGANDGLNATYWMQNAVE